MADAPQLLTTTEGAVLIATLNRPTKLNVLSRETLALFETALHRFRDSPALKVLLIRARGRYFVPVPTCTAAGARVGPWVAPARPFANTTA